LHHQQHKRAHTQEELDLKQALATALPPLQSVMELTSAFAPPKRTTAVDEVWTGVWTHVWTPVV
jgi:hypothetical protein